MQTGGFSAGSLENYQNLLSSLMDEETYDFARCVRPDGTYYGTRGKCIPPNKPAADVEKGAAPQQSTIKKDPTLSQGVSEDSAKVLSTFVNRRNRQYQFMKDALAD
jgi:hypothetical protein